MTMTEPKPVHTNVIQALAAVAADIDAVEKGRSAQGYRYRGIDDVLNALHGPLSRHGVVIVPVVEATERIQRDDYGKGGWFEEKALVRYRIYGPGGIEDFIDAAVPASALDNSDKVMGKVLSYAFKSLAFQMFTLPTDASVDTEAETPPPPPPEPEDTEVTKLRTELLDDIAVLSEDGKAALRAWMKDNKLKLDTRANIERVGEQYAKVLEAETGPIDPDTPVDLVPAEHPQVERKDEAPRLGNIDPEQMKAVYAYITGGKKQSDATPEQTKLGIQVIQRIRRGELALDNGSVVYADSGELYPKEGDHAQAA